MGVLNITPDSFSDGGRFLAPERALVQAGRMAAEGADIIDIGAESTRPYGSQPVSADEEIRRLQPIMADVVSLGIPVSIDSMKSVVVGWALDNGAAIANDIWGLQGDPDMAKLIAERHCPVVIMHNRDQADATGLDQDLDAPRASVERVLDQLLDDGCRPLDDFAGSDLIDDLIGEDANL